MTNVLICVKNYSILDQSSLDDLLKFRFENPVEEWKSEPPLFWSFLEADAAPPRHKNKEKGLKVSNRYPSICMGGAVLLKELCITKICQLYISLWEYIFYMVIYTSL